MWPCCFRKKKVSLISSDICFHNHPDKTRCSYFKLWQTRSPIVLVSYTRVRVVLWLVVRNNYTAVRNNYTAVRNNYTAVRNNYTAVRNSDTAVHNNYTAVRNNYIAVRYNYTAVIRLFVERVTAGLTQKLPDCGVVDDSTVGS